MKIQVRKYNGCFLIEDTTTGKLLWKDGSWHTTTWRECEEEPHPLWMAPGYWQTENEATQFLQEWSTANSQIRRFDTGATRDADKNKLSYIKALSPIVIDCYVEYLGKHRKQADGTLRDWDNWKAGIPVDVYVDGEDRHHRAVWKLHQGYPAYDNHGPVTIKDSLCGVIFNAMGHLHEILKAEEKDDSVS